MLQKEVSTKGHFCIKEYDVYSETNQEHKNLILGCKLWIFHIIYHDSFVCCYCLRVFNI